MGRESRDVRDVPSSILSQTLICHPRAFLSQQARKDSENTELKAVQGMLHCWVPRQCSQLALPACLRNTFMKQVLPRGSLHHPSLQSPPWTKSWVPVNTPSATRYLLGLGCCTHQSGMGGFLQVSWGGEGLLLMMPRYSSTQGGWQRTGNPSDQPGTGSQQVCPHAPNAGSHPKRQSKDAERLVNAFWVGIGQDSPGCTPN